MSTTTTTADRNLRAFLEGRGTFTGLGTSEHATDPSRAMVELTGRMGRGLHPSRCRESVTYDTLDLADELLKKATRLGVVGKGFHEGPRASNLRAFVLGEATYGEGKATNERVALHDVALLCGWTAPELPPLQEEDSGLGSCPKPTHGCEPDTCVYLQAVDQLMQRVLDEEEEEEEDEEEEEEVQEVQEAQDADEAFWFALGQKRVQQPTSLYAGLCALVPWREQPTSLFAWEHPQAQVSASAGLCNLLGHKRAFQGFQGDQEEQDSHKRERR